MVKKDAIKILYLEDIFNGIHKTHNLSDQIHDLVPEFKNSITSFLFKYKDNKDKTIRNKWTFLTGNKIFTNKYEDLFIVSGIGKNPENKMEPYVIKMSLQSVRDFCNN